MSNATVRCVERKRAEPERMDDRARGKPTTNILEDDAAQRGFFV
jgi:hypothetical protein